MIRSSFAEEKPVIIINNHVYDFNMEGLSTYIVKCNVSYDDDKNSHVSAITGKKNVEVKGQYLKATLTVICPAVETISDFNAHYDQIRSDIRTALNLCTFKEHADSDSPATTCIIDPPKQAHYQNCSLYDMYTIELESQEYIL